MDAYKVQTTVKNGQITLDLPSEFNDTAVEVIILKTVSSATELSVVSPLYPPIEENLQGVEETAASPYVQSNLKPTDESDIQKTPVIDESDFWYPREKIDLTQLRGAIKSDLSINEIDAIARSMRGDSPFVPPRKRVKLSTLMGAYKHKMTNDEIDSLTKSWRSE